MAEVTGKTNQEKMHGQATIFLRAGISIPNLFLLKTSIYYQFVYTLTLKWRFCVDSVPKRESDIISQIWTWKVKLSKLFFFFHLATVVR